MWDNVTEELRPKHMLAAIKHDPLRAYEVLRLISSRGISHVWAAGFFDGEGCIYVQKRTRKEGQPGVRDFDIHLRCTVSNTVVEPLECLRAKYGGSIHIAYAAYGNRQTCWVWHVASRKASAFLRAIVPHLVVKREKALKAIYLAHRITTGKSIVSVDEWQAREKLAKQVNNSDVSIEQIIMAAEEAEKK